MKKFLSMFALTVIASVTLAGCSGEESATIEEDIVNPDEVVEPEIIEDTEADAEEAEADAEVVEADTEEVVEEDAE